MNVRLIRDMMSKYMGTLVPINHWHLHVHEDYVRLNILAFPASLEVLKSLFPIPRRADAEAKFLNSLGRDLLINRARYIMLENCGYAGLSNPREKKATYLSSTTRTWTLALSDLGRSSIS